MMKSKHKKMVVAFFILAIIGIGAVWYIFTEKFGDTSAQKAAFTVNASELIKEFEQDPALANKKYTEQIIVVNGIVTEIESADTTANIKFVDTTSGSYIIFAFQQQHIAEAKQLKEGDKVSIKGSCSGGVHSEILGTDFISFKRCALNK